MRSSASWAALAGLLGLGALIAWWMPSAWLDWQPGKVWSQPWRWLSAAFVHWSAQHLVANLGGLAVVAALGLAGGLPARQSVAWLIAWPLTHLALLLQPTLAHYGGLSGVLHAGVAVATVHLVRQTRGVRRLIGALIGVGLVAKLVIEAPWASPLRHQAGWDIAIAPLAHATGAVSGVLCAFVTSWLGARSYRRR